MERRRKGTTQGAGYRCAGALILGLAALAGGGQAAHARAALEEVPVEMSAQDAALVSEIESEADTSATAAGAQALARTKAEAGDLTGAVAVLERYLLVDHEALEPRADYAILLCRLDDVEAGRFEGAKIASEANSGAALERVGQACGEIPQLAQVSGEGE
ncbi:hypothetical protein HT136_21620 [Novosphingobium profundi]|uniref:hypothetical protein n=1 Tax=Novosphingobium profundi TaxID=1774954 RepID=UPI001BDA4259|nr:hypothetical protein [Novosphingobium profundi]MBT0670974.1 hypothetical protein [Novosphingobium profundi]